MIYPDLRQNGPTKPPLNEHYSISVHIVGYYMVLLTNVTQGANMTPTVEDFLSVVGEDNWT